MNLNFELIKFFSSNKNFKLDLSLKAKCTFNVEQEFAFFQINQKKELIFEEDKSNNIETNFKVNLFVINWQISHLKML